MDMGIRDKVAIVAASSKGLGRAVALGLASEGARVTIFSRSSDDINEAADEIREKTGAVVTPLVADVTKREDLQSVLDETVQRHSTVHILVNNAGGPPFAQMEELGTEDWHAALELNLLSTINLTRLAAPYMKEQRWGRVVNITSIAAKEPIGGLILSNTSRAGVLGFSKTVSAELAGYNVLVNSVCPGRIMTGRILELADKRAELLNSTRDEVIEGWNSEIPIGRLGSPGELADLVVFLCSERASYITGTAVQVDGGVVKSLY